MARLCFRHGPLLALLLAAISMAFSFCHLMELPARIGWPQELWVGSTVIGGQYRMFGTLGAFVELSAIVGLGVWWYPSRPAGRLRLAATMLYLAALAIWWTVVFPANGEFALWQERGVPTDWDGWRQRWEFGHAVMAVLKIIGLALVFQSVLPKQPATA